MIELIFNDLVKFDMKLNVSCKVFIVVVLFYKILLLCNCFMLNVVFWDVGVLKGCNFVIGFVLICCVDLF